MSDWFVGSVTQIIQFCVQYLYKLENKKHAPKKGPVAKRLERETK